MRWLRTDARVWILGLATAISAACASGPGCRSGGEYDAVACRVRAAREQLEFGMSRDDAMAALGRAEVEPPWRVNLEGTPASVRNPFDSEIYESPLGESYEVVRYFVEIERVTKCPFLQGRVVLQPLVFFDGKLVGWRWSYVADILDRPIRNEERVFGFGVFCHRAGPRSPEGRSDARRDNRSIVGDTVFGGPLDASEPIAEEST